MAVGPKPVELEITIRNIESGDRIKEYAVEKLEEVARSLPNLRSAAIEVTYENTKSADHRYVVEATLTSHKTVLRVEDRGPNPLPTIDSVHDLLERRIRDWKGHVYYVKRKQGAAYKEAVELERASLLPEPTNDLIVRRKGHELKPMFPEDAVEHMEMLGHDFFFFLNAETGEHNVVYRRRSGGYGLIEPAMSGP